MSDYRRAFSPGGTFFFTVVTFRRHIFDKPEYRKILRDVIKPVRQNHPFFIDAWVLLPEHMHCMRFGA